MLLNQEGNISISSTNCTEAGSVEVMTVGVTVRVDDGVWALWHGDSDIQCICTELSSGCVCVKPVLRSASVRECIRARAACIQSSHWFWMSPACSDWCVSLCREPVDTSSYCQAHTETGYNECVWRRMSLIYGDLIGNEIRKNTPNT